MTVQQRLSTADVRTGPVSAAGWLERLRDTLADRGRELLGKDRQAWRVKDGRGLDGCGVDRQGR